MIPRLVHRGHIGLGQANGCGCLLVLMANISKVSGLPEQHHHGLGSSSRYKHSLNGAANLNPIFPEDRNGCSRLRSKVFGPGASLLSAFHFTTPREASLSAGTICHARTGLGRELWGCKVPSVLPLAEVGLRGAEHLCKQGQTVWSSDNEIMKWLWH